MKGLGTLADWAKGDLNLEKFTEPSMVEPVHNLSIEEILRDYSLGITHTTRQPMYDKGDDLPDQPIEVLEDIVDFHPGYHPLQVPDDLPEEVPEKESSPLGSSPAGEEKGEESQN